MQELKAFDSSVRYMHSILKKTKLFCLFVGQAGRSTGGASN